MANLDQVIEFDTVFNHGVLQRAAVDTGIGTNFNIITDPDGSQLFDLFPATGVRCKAKAVGTNHNARVQQTTLTNQAPLAHGNA